MAMSLFLKFYTFIIRRKFYVKRRLRILDLIVEKGKVSVLGKLCIIELIEADLQILLQIFFGVRNEGAIEEDEHISKFNFGSRKNYSVENSILEKRFIYESNLFSEIGFLVEEAVGVHRDPIITFAKLIPRFKHQIYSSYGILKITYGGEAELLSVSGQNFFSSGTTCREQSCMIFKRMENEE